MYLNGEECFIEKKRISSWFINKVWFWKYISYNNYNLQFNHWIMTIIDNWKVYFTEKEAYEITNKMIKNQKSKFKNNLINQEEEVYA